MCVCVCVLRYCFWSFCKSKINFAHDESAGVNGKNNKTLRTGAQSISEESNILI